MTEQSGAVVRALIDAANSGDLHRVAELYDDDYIDHADGGSRGSNDKDAALRTFEELLAAFPDSEHVIEDLLADGDRVAVRLRATGTHRGSFRGRPPSGRRVEMVSTAIYRVREGRLVERWCDSVSSVADALDAPLRKTPTPVLMRHDDGSWKETPAGGRYRELSLGVLSFTYFELEGRATFEPHQHPNAQITYVLEGELIFDVAGNRHVVGPGDAIGIPGGVIHGVRAGDGPARAVDAWAPAPTHLD